MADQDLAGLPEAVRQAWARIVRAEVCGDLIPQDAMLAVSEGLEHLARENAELRADARHAHARWSEFAQLSGAEQRKRIRAEAELAALKRRIAEAPIVDCYMGAYVDLHGQRVALLPVGGETK